MTRTRRIAVDVDTFDRTGLRWNPGGRNFYGEPGFINEVGSDATLDASYNATLDYAERSFAFGFGFVPGAPNSYVVWGAGVVSFGPVTLAQRHFMTARNERTLAEDFPGSFMSSRFGSVAAYFGDEAGVRDFTPSFGDDFSLVPTYDINEARPIVYISWGYSPYDGSNRSRDWTILLTENRAVFSPVASDFVENLNGPNYDFSELAIVNDLPTNGDDVISGRSGASNDYNALSILKPFDTVNGTLQTAIMLDGFFDFRANTNIAAATTLPHATVYGQGSGVRELYRFTVAQGGGIATFDLDGINVFGSNGFDGFLRLLDANGTQIAFNDDGGVVDAGSVAGVDSFLSYSFTTGGTYYIEVGRYTSSSTSTIIPSGALYTLHVSLERATLTRDFGAVGAPLAGGNGNDRLISGLGDEGIDGGIGSDTVSFENAARGIVADLVMGRATGDGDDSLVNVENIVGGSQGDVLRGNEFINELSGGASDDILLGFAGEDVLDGGSGADRLDGGLDADTLSFASSAEGVVASLLVGGGTIGDAAGDIYLNIENILGSGFADDLFGDNGANRIDGGAGNDILTGGMGGDALIGGAGSGDAASYADNMGAVFVNLSTGQGFSNAAQGDTYSGIENVIASSSSDFVIGDAGINRIEGRDGNDVLIGGLGGDQLIGGNGGDFASYEDNWGGVFVNLASGMGYGNAAQGDTYQGIENLRGGAFADYFLGNGESNRFEGAGGSDTLTGGAGADVFAFTAGLSAASNVDTITDFAAAIDRIELAASVFGGVVGALSANAFVVGSAATTAQHRVIYNSGTGDLFFDADGSGAGSAVLFARLGAGLALTATDFVIG